MKTYFYTLGILDVPEMNKYVDPKRAIECGLECIRLTRPDFEIEKIPDYFLAPHEHLIIYQLATAYIKLEGVDKAIDIWYMVKDNMEKRYAASIEKHPLIISNARYRDLLLQITFVLSKANRHEECLKASEEGLATAYHSNNLLHFVNYLSFKAESLEKLGRADESKEFYKKMLMLHFILDGYGPYSFVKCKKDYEDNPGGTLDLSLPW